MSLLFTPFTIRNVELKNRIMMSPMGTVSAGEDGKVTDWHKLHYGSRALGQVALIMLEVSAVMEQGRDSGSLGIWSDEHIPKLKELTELLQAQGSKAGIQLWLAGRKTNRQGMAVSASEIAKNGKLPRALTIEEVQEIVHAFKTAAVRAAAAGFDVIELHAAHGYLLNDFLSPYTNKRDDRYGGTRDKRFRLMQEVIKGIRSVWKAPLFVRVSAEEYGPEGNRAEDYVYYALRMKELGVDLIDVSSGGVYPDNPKVYPGYQVPYSEQIRRGSGLSTAAVGLITSGLQAEEILQNGRADLIAVGRELLRNPFWPRVAAEQLGIKIDEPAPYRGHWFDYRHAVSE
jgi:NADPH2 dehydrogenase